MLPNNLKTQEGFFILDIPRRVISAGYILIVSLILQTSGSGSVRIIIVPAYRYTKQVELAVPGLVLLCCIIIFCFPYIKSDPALKFQIKYKLSV